MTHDEISLNTKMALAAALKAQMRQKPLKKITVSDLVADCGMNRKTFYYHFEDVYALLRWMLEQEAIEVVKQFDLIAEYEDAILFVLHYVQSNTHILNCIYDGLGREQLRLFFKDDFSALIRSVVDDTIQAQGAHVSEKFKEFLVFDYTELMASRLISLLKEKDPEIQKRTAQYISASFLAGLKANLEIGTKNRF